jgi:hypothetical protein
MSHGGSLPLAHKKRQKLLPNWNTEYQEGIEKELNVVTLRKHFTGRDFHEVAVEIYTELEAILIGYITEDGAVHLQGHGCVYVCLCVCVVGGVPYIKVFGVDVKSIHPLTLCLTHTHTLPLTHSGSSPTSRRAF